MDQERFLNAIYEITKEPRDDKSIGTLAEKTLHAVLKRYFEPDASFTEVKVGKYVADIMHDGKITEIQTGSFNRLRDKLTEFLKGSKVTVVYPVAKVKYLCWIDPDTGEMSSKRRSPKTGRVYDIFRELYKIKLFLQDPNLNLCIILLELTEYRTLNGWSKDRKKGSTRFERIPSNILDEVYINNLYDYRKLLPDDLLVEFTVNEFAKRAGLSKASAGLAVNVLAYIGAIRRTGKRGRAYTYISLI